MMKILSHATINKHISLLSLSHHLLFSTSPPLPPHNPNPNPNPNPNSNPNPRSRTPLEREFDSWVVHLRPGFTSADVVAALRSQSDPDLALDLFRWTSLRRDYRHDAAAYQAIIEIAAYSKRLSQAETLAHEAVSGACAPSLPLFNSILRLFCSRRHLLNAAFDVFNKMCRTPGCRPSLDTYALLLNSLLRRFNRLNVSYVYLHSVRSLVKRMKASGVVPDTFTLNLIIKAFSKCLEMDEAVRVFREMRLYGCEPDGFTYSYIAKGLCEKGWVEQGFGFYKEMREKGFVPRSSMYVVLICSLSMERRFDDAIGALFDMLESSMAPDHLTYRTLLEGLCREGRGNEAFELLEELRKKDGSMGEKMYSALWDGMNLLCRS